MDGDIVKLWMIILIAVALVLGLIGAIVAIVCLV